MNAGKLDPLLGKILREETAPQAHTVLIRAAVDLDAAHWAVLERLGVRRGPRPGRTLSARLGRAAIAALSDEKWIETIRLAPQSRPLAPSR